MSPDARPTRFNISLTNQERSDLPRQPFLRCESPGPRTTRPGGDFRSRTTWIGGRTSSRQSWMGRAPVSQFLLRHRILKPDLPQPRQPFLRQAREQEDDLVLNRAVNRLVVLLRLVRDEDPRRNV